MKVAQAEGLKLAEADADLVDELHGDAGSPTRRRDLLHIAQGFLPTRRKGMVFESFDKHPCLAEQERWRYPPLEETHRFVLLKLLRNTPRTRASL
jgi:hypothetical protein